MPIDFKSSETKINLVRAFAGESQARNRYTFAYEQSKKQNMYVVGAIFKFTADQEKEHAEIFYKHLKDVAGENIKIDGGYPIDISNSIIQLLRYAQHNEYEEYDPVYKSFADTAENEGFPQIAASFRNISGIEKTHGDRFGKILNLLEQNKLFVSDTQCKWMCLNCGYIFEGTEVPQACPVCSHNKGYFIRLELAPYTDAN